MLRACTSAGAGPRTKGEHDRRSLTVVVAGRFLQGTAAAALAPSALFLTRAQHGGRGREGEFALNVPIGIVVYVVGAKAIGESADPEHTALDPAGQLLGVLWLAVLSWGLIEGGRRGWATLPTITALGLAFAAFLAVEMRQGRPMLPLALVRDREVAKTCLIAFVIGFAPVSVYVFIPIYMQQVEGHSAATTGVLLVVLGAGLGISMPATNNAAIAAVASSGAASSRAGHATGAGFTAGLHVIAAVSGILCLLAASAGRSGRAGHTDV